MLGHRDWLGACDVSSLKVGVSSGCLRITMVNHGPDRTKCLPKARNNVCEWYSV